MQFTFMLTGDSLQSISEMQYMFDTMLAGICQLKVARLDKVSPEDADVFLCGLSQITWASQVLPREKILITEPRFAKDFFHKVKDLPQGAVVGIPHSNSFRTNMIIQGLRNLGHTTQLYLPILPTQPESVQKSRLARADVILGTERYLDYYLAPELGYAAALRPGTRIIKSDRITRPESVCHIINWLKGRYRRRVQQRIGALGIDGDMATIARLDEAQQRCLAAEDALNKATALILEKGRDPETTLSKEEINALIRPPFETLSQLTDDLTA